eukprot:3908687-Pyramimonas_sp.AAC.1
MPFDSGPLARLRRRHPPPGLVRVMGTQNSRPLPWGQLVLSSRSSTLCICVYIDTYTYMCISSKRSPQFED